MGKATVNRELLDKFLQENNLEIKPKLVVQDQEVYSCLKQKVVNLVLSCLQVGYEVEDANRGQSE